MSGHTVAEVCGGAGGQALGLEAAGFEHLVIVEMDRDACATLRRNRPGWNVAEGDMTSAGTWNPAEYRGVDLLAGGVPCQPFTVAGKQLGAADERDLFSRAVELAGVLRPRALLLENVAGLSQDRFAGYRQHVLDRLASFGYVAEWRRLEARDFGVPQLRPRFILVAMRPADFACFAWPEPQGPPPSVGEVLGELMGERGWPGARAWAERASRSIAPTIVGGSKKHGGADLGPTRARAAWAQLGVDGRSIADLAPPADAPAGHIPKLTLRMVAEIQGFPPGWEFSGRKTSAYRQVGNAFPPPVAQALGVEIAAALKRDRRPAAGERTAGSIHDEVYSVLRADGGWLSVAQIMRRLRVSLDAETVTRRLSQISCDFVVEIRPADGQQEAFRLGPFRAFTAAPEQMPAPGRRRVRRLDSGQPAPAAGGSRRSG